MAIQDMTPEQRSFLARLLGGQQGDATSPLLPGGVMNPAGGLFTGASPGTPVLPGRPEVVLPPGTPGTTGPIGEPGEPGDPTTLPPIIDPPPPDVERPEGDDTPIDLPPEEEDEYVDANGNGIPDIYEPYYAGPVP